MSEVRNGPGLWRLMLYNLLRKPGRSVAAALGVLLATAVLFAGGVISMGASHAVQTGLERLGADLMVVPRGAADATHTALVVGEPVAFYMDGQVAQQVAAVAGVGQVSPQVYVETLSSSACCTGRIFLVGFDPQSDFTVQPWLLSRLGRVLSDGEIIVGNHVLTLPGDPMKFYGSDYIVAERLEPTGMGMDETVFLPMESVDRMAAASVTEAEKPLAIPDGQISAVMVRVEADAEPEAVARAIESQVAGVSVLTGGAVTRGVTRDLAGLMGWLLPTAGGVLLVSVLMLGLLFSAITVERSREIGLLRAMGATARQAVGILVGEAVLLGLTGGLLGVLAGWAVFGLFQKAILVSYVLPFLWPSAGQQAGLAIGVILAAGGVAALAAAYPAWRIARLDPHFALHGGKS